MASNQTTGCQPVTVIDWKDLLQSLAAYVEKLEADSIYPEAIDIDAKSRAGRIGNYIADLEYCLRRANHAIGYYESLIKNYDRLVAVMEEDRNQAYDVIGRLKNEIAAAKKYNPLTDGEPGETPRTEKGASNE